MIKLLTAATATNSPPSGATAGFSMKKGDQPGRPEQGFLVSSLDECLLTVASTAGSGTMTCTLRLWGYDDLTATWAPLGTSTTLSNRGVINEATALGEDVADTIRHREVVESLRHLNRVYLEIVAIAGTNTAISAWLTHVN
jgi:hypothetical protein